MRTWKTKIYALDSTMELRTYSGPYVEAPTKELAIEHCENNGLGYCHVEGELLEVIPTKDDGTPDHPNTQSFENLN